MTKQQKIREEVARKLYWRFEALRHNPPVITWEEALEVSRLYFYQVTDSMFSYLDSQGVAIKGMMLTFEGEPVGFEVEPLVEK